MPIKLKANNGNIDLKVPIKQVGGKVDSVNGMTGDVVLDIPSKTSDLVNDSGFLTEHQSLADYAKKSEIPDVSGFLTSIPDEYVTEAELDAKGYLTEHQSLSEYAKKSELFSKDYNDLTNKPTIPSVEGLASTQYVDNKVATKQDKLTAGNNITIKNGVISASGSSYTLPVADYDTLGGVKAKQTEPDKQYGLVYIDSDARLRVPVARQGVNRNAGIVLPSNGHFKVEDDGLMNLLPASSIEIGGVKPDGTTTTTDKDGTIHAVMPEPYTLPTASTTTLGGVKVDGTSITIADGVISADLPTKTSDLTNDSGFITNEYHDITKQDKLVAGDNITISGNVISSTGGGGSYTLPVASSTVLGGVKVGGSGSPQPPNGGRYVFVEEDGRLFVAPPDMGNLRPGVVVPGKGLKLSGSTIALEIPTKDVYGSYSIGGVKPDNTTTTVEKDGTIHAHTTLPIATTTTVGSVKPDGTTITIDSKGVITANIPTKTSDLTNDSNFITTEYHDYTKQNVLIPGDNITITSNHVISATQPARYIESASVTGNTLKLYYNNDTLITFTPTGGSGGGSGGVSGYAFSSNQSLTDNDKTHLKEVYNNKNIHMTIDNLTVIRIMSFGSKRGFVVVNTNGATSNQVLVYTIDIDSSGNITSNTFTLFMSYYLVGNSSALSGDIITSENWSQYISAGGGDWQYTSSSADSNLYNAKEMVLYWQDNSSEKHQSYLNFTANFNFETGQTLGTGWTNQVIRLDADDTIGHPYINYDGSSITTSNCVIFYILYKT